VNLITNLLKDQIFESDSYHAMMHGKISERNFHRLRLKQILSADSFTGQKVLDLGCGSGVVLIPLATRGIDITGIDKSKYAIQKCDNYCKSKGLNADIMVGDVKK